MLYILTWYIALYTNVFVASISVNIDGVIDLGPSWHYEYNIKSENRTNHTNGTKPFYISSGSNVNMLRKKDLKDKKHKIKIKKATVAPSTDSILITMQDALKPPGIYARSRLVKEDDRIHEFTYHVYKQSLSVFEEIKKKVDPAIRRKVDFLSKSYDNKFREFINETLNYKIKTRLGTKRVVLNIIETSNRLLKRLVNYFVGDLQREGKLTNNMAAANVFRKEVDRECDLEMRHACKKFGICRSSSGVSKFLINVFTIIVKSDDHKIKQANDALTEVLKNTDFSKIMETDTRTVFKMKIDKVEAYNANMLRAMYGILKNVLALKNQPIDVMITGSDHINKTVALLEVIDELDKSLPADDENILQWTNIKTSLTDWSDGKRHDILEIMQGLVTFIKKKGIDKMDNATAQSMNDKLNLILS